MTNDSVSATTTVKAPAEAVFSLLADPTQHPAIDGTGRVLEALDPEPLTASGQVFRMAMYHEHHWNPDGRYRMANVVRVFAPPRAISWEPGQEADDGSLSFGGWVWRYDLTPLDPSTTEVTLTYDWSAVPPFVRQRFEHLPPFASDHLDRSLSHLAGLVTV